jgi:hypothetical protein
VAQLFSLGGLTTTIMKTISLLIAIIGAAILAGCSTTPPSGGYNAVALAQDRALLLFLRAGDTTNAIQRLEDMVDLGTYRSMTSRASLKDKDRDRLDVILKKVASYREQFPRPIDAPSPDSRAKEQRQIDDFLHYIAAQFSFTFVVRQKK